MQVLSGHDCFGKYLRRIAIRVWRVPQRKLAAYHWAVPSVGRAAPFPSGSSRPWHVSADLGSRYGRQQQVVESNGGLLWNCEASDAKRRYLPFFLSAAGGRGAGGCAMISSPRKLSPWGTVLGATVARYWWAWDGCAHVPRSPLTSADGKITSLLENEMGFDQVEGLIKNTKPGQNIWWGEEHPGILERSECFPLEFSSAL